jgi:hypothetical protein
LGVNLGAKLYFMKQVILSKDTETLLETYLATTGQSDASKVVDDLLRSHLEDVLLEKDWADADLSRLGEYEPYDWGDTDLEHVGKPISYVRGQGFIVHE